MVQHTLDTVPGTVQHSVAMLGRYGLEATRLPGDGGWVVARMLRRSGQPEVVAELDTDTELEALAFGVLLGVAAVK